jgi:GTP cyclohydrolase II
MSGTAATDRIEEAVRDRLRAPGTERPVVTLSWAQSATGAIAAAGGARTAISGPESMALTHRMRAMHDAILVGINTVLTDDPLLSVRLAEGSQPQPVVLDSRLRFPLGARLLARTDRKPWIFHASGRGSTVAEELERQGAVLFAVANSHGGLDLQAVLAALAGAGISSLMVEGGARVLRAFITLHLAAQAVVTESRLPIEGVPGPGIPPMKTSRKVDVGDDVVTWGLL